MTVRKWIQSIKIYAHSISLRYSCRKGSHILLIAYKIPFGWKTWLYFVFWMERNENHKIYLLQEMKNWSKEGSFGDEWNWKKIFSHLFLHFSFLIASNFSGRFLLLLRNWIKLISQYTKFLTLVEVKFFIGSNKNKISTFYICT